MSHRIHRALRVGVVVLALVATASCDGDGDDEPTPDEDSAETTEFEVTLSGKGVGPEPGDDDGTGSGTVTIDGDSGKVCVDLTTAGLGEVVAVHLQRGSIERSGPIVLPLPTAEAGKVEGCVEGEPAAVGGVLDNPGEYFINVRTRDIPGGAIRGPLDAEAAATATTADRGPRARATTTTAP